MVLLDVVYNHFGPDGNYLHGYAPQFFTDGTRRPGARRSISTATRRARCASSSSTTRCTGSRSSTSTACASTPCTPSPTTAAPHFVDEHRRRRVRAAGPRAPRPPGARERAQPGAPACVATPTADARAADRAVERRLPPRAARAADRRDATATTPTTPSARRQLWPRARRRLRLPGRALALSQRRAARRAERRAAADGVRRLSCRTTTRSATAPSASAWRTRPTPQRCDARIRAACCWRRTMPMLFMGEEFARLARRSCTSATSAASWRGAVREAGATSSRASPHSPTPRCASRIPDPNAHATFERSQAALGRARATACARWLELVRRLLALRRERMVPLPRSMARGARAAFARATARPVDVALDAAPMDRAGGLHAQPGRRRQSSVALPAAPRRSAPVRSSAIARRRAALAPSPSLRRLDRHGARHDASRSAVLSGCAARHGIAPDYHDIWGHAHQRGAATTWCAASGRSSASMRAAPKQRQPPSGATTSSTGTACWRRSPRSRADQPDWSLPISSASWRDRLALHASKTAADAAAPIAPATARRARRSHEPLPPGYHRFSIAGAETLSTLVIAAPDACYQPAALRRRRPGLGPGGAALRAALAAQLGHRRFQRPARLVDHGPGAARAWSASIRCTRCSPHNPRTQPVQPVVAAAPQHALHRRRGGRRAAPNARRRCRSIASRAVPGRARRAARQPRRSTTPAVAAAKSAVLRAAASRTFARRIATRRRARAAPRSAPFAMREGAALRRHAAVRSDPGHASRAPIRRCGAGRCGPRPIAIAERAGRSPSSRTRHARGSRLPRLPAVARRRCSSPRRAGAARDAAWRSACTSTSRSRSTAPAPKPGPSGDVYARGATVGAPPDEFNRRARTGACRRCAPTACAATATHPSSRRCAREHAPRRRAAHRPRDGPDAPVLDSARALGRRDGAYVHYPLDELLAIVALESQRQRCLVDRRRPRHRAPTRIREAMARYAACCRTACCISSATPTAPSSAGDDYPRRALVARQHARPADARRLVERPRPRACASALGLFPEGAITNSSSPTARRSASACCSRSSAPGCCPKASSRASTRRRA